MLTGLSPRMRGNLQTTVARGDANPSIPAYAGEPTALLQRHLSDNVYPRVCGGTRCSGLPSDTGCRLSPRMRGNLAQLTHEANIGTSIPAYAGEPAGPPPLGNLANVYPRVCGGTNFRSAVSKSPVRLSPRMRGNPGCGGCGGCGRASIPAYAGEPWSSIHRPPTCRVYPRVCGGT